MIYVSTTLKLLIGEGEGLIYHSQEKGRGGGGTLLLLLCS